MPIFRDYLRSLREIRASGQAVAETSYYGTLETLLNDLGKSLKPRVRSVINLKNRGAGIPDGGFFTEEQFAVGGDDPFGAGQLPSRGVLEVKSTAEAVEKTAQSAQVAKYLARYGLVLVTNYRDFLLVAQDKNGELDLLERYTVAEEAEFWSADIDELVAAHSERLKDFLRRVMAYRAPLTNPKDLAWFLASYAREALSRIETSDLPSLQNVRDALEDALGINFQGDKGDHFFRSTLVQTLFYGVFSAWVLWSKANAPTSRATFSWKEAAWTLQVPVIRALFERVATPSRLNTLGLVEVLDWTGDALNRVDRAAFFETFDQGQAVQYFYEPFLDAFDPELRRELGVWYTPPEVVRYMVERVDRALRDELGIPDGLADENVYVLDPCCGTGTYLLAVLERIGKTLRERGGDALLGSDLKRAATRRVFGFEILPAPFVVAHLQLGLLLQELRSPLKDSADERAAVYLTNALTGWEGDEAQPVLNFPELSEERDAAGEVKKQTKVLVVLGNPPYNGFAGLAVDEERQLSDAYRTTKRAPAPRGQGLNDLYIRFYRMAERQIVEQTGRGVVCYISNYSWLDGLSFTGMRERYLDLFDHIWIDSLNGDKYRTGKLTPDGKPDPSVFSTEFNREGIQVGTAVALLTRTSEHEQTPHIHFRNLWGKDKLTQLEETDFGALQEVYEEVEPVVDVGFPFMPTDAAKDYYNWSLLTEIFPMSFPGVKTSRDDFLVDDNEEELRKRMEMYFNPNVNDEEMKRVAPSALTSTSSFDARTSRRELQKRGFLPQNLVRYFYRPFDTRWLYWEAKTKLLDRERAEYFEQLSDSNLFLFTTGRTRKIIVEPAISTSLLSDLNAMDSGARGFPLYLKDSDGMMFEEVRPNLTEKALSYLTSTSSDEKALFYHCLAISHSFTYRTENADALRHDWPRIPLPKSQERLLASVKLGREVAGLLETETPVAGVSTGAVRAELRTVGGVSAVAGHSLDPEADLELTAGWGHFGSRNAVMPGKGRAVERDYTPEELASVEAGARALGLTLEEVLDLLGTTTYDVYLNDRAYWRNVPSRVWDYTIGGYQVIKKWLSYREAGVLGRALEVSEARHVSETARRIAGLLLLEPQLNESYGAVKADTYSV